MIFKEAVLKADNMPALLRALREGLIEIQTASKTAIANAAKETNTSPTETQKQTGNYRKGKVDFQGLELAIETPKGATRSGTDANGNTWAITMKHHYGEIKKTHGADGDPVDFFLGETLLAETVFIIDQINPVTREFDEHKVMLGFGSAAEAKKAYLSNYHKGWAGVGAITGMPIAAFKKWVHAGRKTVAMKYGGKATLQSINRYSEYPPEIIADALRAGIEDNASANIIAKIATSLQALVKMQEGRVKPSNIVSAVHHAKYQKMAPKQFGIFAAELLLVTPEEGKEALAQLSLSRTECINKHLQATNYEESEIRLKEAVSIIEREQFYHQALIGNTYSYVAGTPLEGMAKRFRNIANIAHYSHEYMSNVRALYFAVKEYAIGKDSTAVLTALTLAERWTNIKAMCAIIDELYFTTTGEQSNSYNSAKEIKDSLAGSEEDAQKLITAGGDELNKLPNYSLKRSALIEAQHTVVKDEIKNFTATLTEPEKTLYFPLGEEKTLHEVREMLELKGGEGLYQILPLKVAKMANIKIERIVGNNEEITGCQRYIQELIDNSPVSDEQAEQWYQQDVTVSAKVVQMFERDEIAYAGLKKEVKEFYRITGGKLPLKAIKTTTKGRSFARQSEQTVYLGNKASTETLWHELGHLLECRPNVLKAAKMLLVAREAVSKGIISLRKLTNLHYGRGEVAINDSFYDPYVGKLYGFNDGVKVKDVTVTEVVSMGFQTLQSPAAFKHLKDNDPEHLKLTLGLVKLLQGVVR